jgi:pimeloyl-ACP methyl ester carboxylesterase
VPDVTKLVPIGDAMIEIHARGDGPVVLLVPSAARSFRDYEELGAALVEAGFRPVAVNPRGIGESTGRLADLTLHDFAADVAGVIERLDLAPAHLLGHAWGNRVVRVLTADRPELVRSVTLLAAGGMVPPVPGVGAHAAVIGDPEASSEAFHQAVEAMFFAPGNDGAAWVDGWWREMLPTVAEASWKTPREEWWAVPGVPLLVIQGLQDVAAVPENGRALVAETPGARLVELDGAGHALLPEQPKAVAQHLVEFLTAVEDGTPSL